MYEKLDTILYDILQIIRYSKNKADFIHTFRKQCRQIAVIDLIQTLPTYKKEELKKRLKDITQGERGRTIILSYFTQQQYEQMINNISVQALQEYIMDILPQLPSETQTKLQEYLKPIFSNFS